MDLTVLASHNTTIECTSARNDQNPGYNHHDSCCTMHTKMVIAAVLTAPIVTGILPTTIAAYAGESETEAEQKLKQNNVGSFTS